MACERSPALLCRSNSSARVGELFIVAGFADFVKHRSADQRDGSILFTEAPSETMPHAVDKITGFICSDWKTRAQTFLRGLVP